MRNLIKLVLISLFHTSLFAAATFDANVNAADLASQIQGRGITITNPVITRGRSNGNSSQFATFKNGISGANLQVDEGILLTASSAKEAFSTNSSGQIGIDPGNINNIAGLPANDPDLQGSLAIPFNLRNQAVFEFDVTLDANTRLLLVDYQFASDEYPEWVGTIFNDPFGFFVSGGDLTQTYNIARVVDDTILVSTSNIANYATVNVNNVNGGFLGFNNQNPAYSSPAILTNAIFFIDNGGTNTPTGGVNPANAKIVSEFDGFTTRLHATLDNLTPGETYHFKMAVADASDAMYDAGVFVNKIVGVREPSLCYDYDVRVGSDITLPANDSRNIQTTVYPGEGLNLGIVLKSLEGEIDFTDSNMTVLFNPNSSLRLNSAQISPDTINAYLPIADNLIQKTPYAKIPVGENLTSAGGTISSNQIIFTKLQYDINGSSNLNVNFDINASMKMNLNGLIVPRTVSTLNGSLPRCAQETGYHPEWAAFNIERNASNVGPINLKPILYTQIANRPFSVEVVSYDPFSPNMSTEKPIEDATFEVEMIDAEKYANSDKSIFTCREPSSITTTQFATFNNLSSRVLVPRPFNTQTALRNAALRLWYFADGNNTLIKYTDTTANGFDTLYNARFRDIIDTAPYFCDARCTNSTGDGTANDCYQCLKTYFARPICSRDNFSVRPESYRVAISDNNQSANRTAPEQLIATNDGTMPIGGMPIATLAAEYSYIIQGQATQWGSGANVLGYYGAYDSTTQNELKSTLLFNQPGTCANENNATVGIIFRNGIINFVATNDVVNVNGANQFAHNNTGRYNYHLEDTNWTLVDQKRYTDKTFPNIDDCIYANDASMYNTSASPEQRSGCGFSSNHTAALTSGTYQDLPLMFEPYKFGLDLVNFTRRPNKDVLFMNDFNQTAYYTPPLSANISMSASYEGNVTAQGFNGTVLSNFTTGCTASDVVLNVGRIMNPAEGLNNVPFQQYLEVGLNVVDTNQSVNGTLLLPATAFVDGANGHAAIKLHTTLKKPYGIGNAINPITVNYTDLNATGPNATSWADSATHIPDGGNTYDQNITFVYGKVTPLKRLYNDVETASQLTPIFADVYCSLGPIQCGNEFNLTQNSRGQQETEQNNWWLATIFTQAELGNNTLAVSHDEEKNANPAISVNAAAAAATINNVQFDDSNATQLDINVSVSGAARPSTVRIDYTPPPWLATFDPLVPPSNDFYRVRFIGPSSWVGVGKTGHVSDVESSNEGRRKMNW